MWFIIDLELLFSNFHLCSLLGTFQVKKDIVAKCTWNALMRFDEELLGKAVERVSLKEIRFINIDSEATASMVKTFRKCWNEYRFTPTAKTSTEFDQWQRKVRRSNSFSGLRSKLNGENNLNEKSSLKTTEKSSPKSSMTSPIDAASVDISIKYRIENSTVIWQDVNAVSQ